MTFLPIVQRELRVASRKPGTWWIRLATSALAMLACGSFLFVSWFGASPQSLGGVLFNILTWYCFGLCLLAGVFVTSDCLSEEKREGTLGLLFLTDLRGHDVVFGKFLARSLNSFYSLFALLPVLSITLLMGGVVGAEFARVSMALINALFVSLAAGIIVSAYSQDYREATARAVCLLALLVVGLPMLAAMGDWVAEISWLGVLKWFSPWQPFHLGFESRYAFGAGDFWSALGCSHLLGWLMLVATSWRLPRVWQVQPSVPPKHLNFRVTLPKRLRKGESFATRARWLNINPVLWLNRRFAGSSVLIWLLVVLSCVPFLLGLLSDEPLGLFIGFTVISRPVHFLIKLLVAIEACRFFAESRRTGAIELLLSSPLSNEQIRQGQWMAMRRFFFAPMCLFLMVSLAALVFAVMRSGEDDMDVLSSGAFFGTFSVYPLVKFVTDIYAVCYVGLWLSISCKKPQHAAAWTMLWVLVIPSVAPVPDVIVDICLIAWAKGHLDGDIRWHIRRHFEPPVKVVRGSARPPSAPPSLPGGGSTTNHPAFP